MNNRLTLLMAAAALFLLLLLTGCFGGGSVKTRPEPQLRAETALKRGIRAEQKGDFTEARIFLTETLDLSSSIEDQPSVVTALINLARLHRLHHELQNADEYIGRACSLAVAGNIHVAEAMHEKALLELTKGSPSTALPLAERAVNAETLQTKTGSRLNLVSRIQLLLGHRTEAENSAQRALAANQSSGQAEEESNSLRLLGIIARDRGAFVESVTLLEQALAIDKGLGISGKIALDLDELASTSQMAGRLQESKDYLERASVVNRAAGRTESSKSSKEKIQIPQTPRKSNGPENNQVSGKESETIRPSSKP